MDNESLISEFAWTESDFSRVQGLIYQRAGISLHSGKHAMVYSRLSRRLRETGHQCFKDYLDFLELGENSESQEFINALTTNLTSFFREQHHFEVLASYLKAKPEDFLWRIWCCAASTGEEPYSIAMTAIESLTGSSKFRLVASDVDSKVLALAGNGVYKLESLKGVSESRIKRFFLRGKGLNEGKVKVKSDLQDVVDFLNVNLVNDNWPFKCTFNIVFCRNVMIYFDGVTQRKVLEGIHRTMVLGGLLFVGHAENFSDSRDLFVLKGKTVYERI